MNNRVDDDDRACAVSSSLPHQFQSKRIYACLLPRCCRDACLAGATVLDIHYRFQRAAKTTALPASFERNRCYRRTNAAGPFRHRAVDRQLLNQQNLLQIFFLLRDDRITVSDKSRWYGSCSRSKAVSAILCVEIFTREILSALADLCKSYRAARSNSVTQLHSIV